LLERLIRNSDKNGDGKLSSEEFSAGLAQERPKSEIAAGAPGGGRPGPGGGQVNPEQFFRMMDRNSDGKLTVEEVPEERRERFKEMLSRADENKDGAVSLEEFSKVAGRRPGGPNTGNGGNPTPQAGTPGQGAPGMGMFGGAGPLLAALDADRDGELSADEISKAADALKKLDRDGDGKLTRNEIAPRPPMAGTGTPGNPGERPDGSRMLAYFKQQDKDGDGKLSKDEVGERMRENFSRIDTNADGFLDETELKQMVERIGGAGGRPGGRPGQRPEGDRPKGDGSQGDGSRGEGAGSNSNGQGRRPGAGDRPQ
jgi:Ca2+-binding EF-hand superfamily protein